MEDNNYRSSNRGSIFYLYEIFAIPLEIRESYLKNLLKGKKSSNKKNIRLLKIIYNKVEKEEFYSWENKDICNKLEFRNVNQLYWYKTKILKDLREMFFGWEKIEKDLESKSEKEDGSQTNVLLTKIRKMNEIGMVKEAKVLCHRLSKQYDNCDLQKLKSRDLLILSEVYNNLLHYYFLKKDLRNFDKFFKKVKAIYNLSCNIKFNLSEKEKALIKIKFLLGEDSRNAFNFYDTSQADMRIDHVNQILHLTKKFNYYKITIQLLYKLAMVLLPKITPSSVREKQIEACLQEGLKLSIKYNLKARENSFRSEILLRKLAVEQNKGDSEICNLIEDLYKKSKMLFPAGSTTILCLDAYVSALAYYKDEKYTRMLQELIKMRILSSEIALALTQIYMTYSSEKKSGLYHLSYYNANSKKFIIPAGMDLMKMKDAENLCRRNLIELKNIHSTNVRAIIMLDLLYYEFLRGKNFNLDKVYLLIRKIQRLRKKNRQVNEVIKNYFELLRIGLIMFEESQKYNAEQDILNKYLKQYSELCDKIMQKDNFHLNLGSMYINMTHIARTLGYKELWKVAEKQWHYLEENHPQIVDSLYKQLHRQEEKSKAA